MTLEELRQVLEESGIPFAYHHWEHPHAPPYGVYFVPYTRAIGADDRAVAPVQHVQAELYTARKEPDIEQTLEARLDAADLFYEKTETYLSGQRRYQIIYEIEVL